MPKSKTVQEEFDLSESVRVAKKAAGEAHSKGMNADEAESHIFNAVNAAHKGSEGAGGMATRVRIDRATDAGVEHFKKLKSMRTEEVEISESVRVAKKAAVEAHSKGMNADEAESHIFNAVNAHYSKDSEGVGGMGTRVRIDRSTDAGVDHFNKLKGMRTEEIELDEATAAAATLAPESMPAEGKSKAGMMASVMGAMNGMKKSDLVDFFNQAMAQFGPNKFPGADAAKTAQNQASIKAKTSVKEDVEDMFDGEEISEEFKTKVETVFEAAVNARLELETARITEEQEDKFNSLVEEYKGELTEQVDEYLSYAVEQWAKDNKIVLENSLKLEVLENFFTGVKNLFVENNIDIPDEQVSLVGELEAKVESLEARVNEEIEKNINLVKVNEELERERTFNEVAEGLAISQAEKLRTLSENITYSDVKEFASKLAIIKETYFSKKPSRVVSEEVVGVDELSESKNNAPVTGQMAVYAHAISRTIKNV